jgi:hypothetical protein
MEDFNMKEIRETKLVEQTTVKWVANDGKEFSTERDCAAHERRCDTEKCEKEYKKLHPKYLDIPYIDWCGNCTVEIVTMESERDFDVIVDYFASVSDYMDISDLERSKPTEFPCAKVVVSDEGYVTFSNWSTEEVKNKLLDAANKI